MLFEDWSNSKWFTTASKRNKVPDSCCKTESEGCGVRDHPSNIPYTVINQTYVVCQTRVIDILFNYRVASTRCPTLFKVA